jgi:nucleoside-diphosphate-sugar epimerase
MQVENITENSVRSRLPSILLLGATGFIGNAVYRLLSQRSDMELCVLLRKPQPGFDGGQVFYGTLENFDWEQLEVVPDVIIHLARINSRRWAGWGRWLAARRGYTANKRLLQYLDRHGAHTRIIYASGSLMYGNNNNPVYEDSNLSPISFARQYIKAERPFLRRLEKQTTQGPGICLLRVPWVLGRGSWFQAFYLNFIRKYKCVPQYGSGENRMSFVAVEDLARCIHYLVVHPFQGVLNVAAPFTATQKAFCSAFAQQLQLDVKELPLHNQEIAVREAFTSNIALSSRHDFLQPCILCNTLEKLIEKQLPFLKDVQ